MNNVTNKLLGIYKSKRVYSFIHGIWLFPAILTVVLIILSALHIHGSSMGVYHTLFYGDQPDSSLLYGQPQSIRSDEWVVSTQKVIAQKNNDYSTVNKNLGNGENETLWVDAPTRDWSVLFRLHDLGFFVFSFDTAFSFRWWAMSYLLVLSSYFFILVLIPGKRLLASLLSLAVLFSPFFQWWYQYITLGSVYYCLFGAVVFIKLLHSKQKREAKLWSALLAYISTAFILILYPPFQIPCALIILAFVAGYLIDHIKNIDKKILRRNLLYFTGSILISLLLVGLFVYQKSDLVSIMQNTAYPGQRIIKSGGYNMEHLLSSNLSPALQSITRANQYSRPTIGATNQSEASNFILLFPFLILPLIYFGIKKYKRKKQIDYVILLLSISTIGFMAWLFVPGLDIAGKLTLLDKVPHSRLLIGIGLLNIIITTLFIKIYSEYKNRLGLYPSIVLTLLLTIFYLLLNFHVLLHFPGFIGYNLAVVLAIPIPVIIFCFMRKYFLTGAALLLAFSFASTFHVNPLYIGTGVLTETPVSTAIKSVTGTSQKKWASEEIALENFATMNGAQSLTGTYLYPQLDIWRKLNQTDKEALYNRYAHVNFTFDRTPGKFITPIISSPSGDQLNVKIEPCDNFLKQNNVGFLITSVEFKPQIAPCATLAKTVAYPRITYFLYTIDL